MRKALKIPMLAIGGTLVAFALLVMSKYGSTAPPTSVMEPWTPGAAMVAGTGAATLPQTGVTLPELVCFGAAWQMPSKDVGMPPIILGGGFANARVERTGDKRFFAGTVERLDQHGKITDVVLAFAGAQGAGDFIQGESLAHDRVLAEPKWAAVLFERVWNDPRYAKARIHVTGHSLGAGYAEFVGTEAVARHGIAAAASRMDIVAFGVPNWGPQSARYFHVGPHVLDGIFTGYTALNDPVITNGGTERIGTSHLLPPFTGLSGLGALFNVVAAHWPTTYMSALGLPNWLTVEQKAKDIHIVSALFITGKSYDPKYARRAGG